MITSQQVGLPIIIPGYLVEIDYPNQRLVGHQGSRRQLEECSPSIVPVTNRVLLLFNLFLTDLVQPGLYYKHPCHSFINSLGDSSFVKLSSKHLYFLTVKARQLTFLDNFHLPKPRAPESGTRWILWVRIKYILSFFTSTDQFMCIFS